MSTTSIKLDVTYQPLSVTVGDLREFVALCEAHGVPDDAPVDFDGAFVNELAVDCPVRVVDVAPIADPVPAPVLDSDAASSTPDPASTVALEPVAVDAAAVGDPAPATLSELGRA
ncbi:MAG TPA: hypothetical protein VGC04_11305 [Cellulomonas sp.]